MCFASTCLVASTNIRLMMAFCSIVASLSVRWSCRCNSVVTNLFGDAFLLLRLDACGVSHTSLGWIPPVPISHEKADMLRNTEATLLRR